MSGVQTMTISQPSIGMSVIDEDEKQYTYRRIIIRHLYGPQVTHRSIKGLAHTHMFGGLIDPDMNCQRQLNNAHLEYVLRTRELTVFPNHKKKPASPASQASPSDNEL